MSEFVLIQRAGGAQRPISPAFVPGIVGDSSQSDICLINPPVVMAARGVEQSIDNGNLAFRLSADSPGEIVLFVSAPTSDLLGNEGIDGLDSDTIVLVLDHVTIEAPNRISSASGIAGKLYEMSPTARGIRFSPRAPASPWIICPNPLELVDNEDRDVVLAHLSASAAWVSYAGAPEDAAATLEDSGRGVAALEVFRSPAPEAHLGGSAASERQATLWKSNFASEEERWDRCYTTSLLDRGKVRLDCSNTSFIADRPRRTSADPFTAIFSWIGNIFARKNPNFVRVTLTSDPIDAAIFLGPLRQRGRTATIMDIPEKDLPSARFEKSGYKACGYRSWRKSEAAGSRKAYEVFCKLEPTSTPKPKPRQRRRSP